MTAIWLEQDGGTWSLQPSAQYENEQALHDIVVSTPELLPLSGSPRLTVIGREVRLPSSGYADVIAFEPDGRPVIIEVKLKNNAESRRAVVAQTLSLLHGIGREDLEENILIKHLDGRSLFERVRESTQDEDLTQSEFETSLETHLAEGSPRVVVVLDEAPAELIDLMGYLEAVTTGLSLDLIVVNSYQIGGHRIAVPQRLDPEHRPESAVSSRLRPRRRATAGHLEFGVQAFRDLIGETPEQYQSDLTLMANWVEELASTVGGVTAETWLGVEDVSLLPRFRDEKVGLVSLWRYAGGKPAISFWRSVFERRAAEAIPEVERLIGKRIGQGNTTSHVTPELLSVLRNAYEVGATVTR